MNGMNNPGGEPVWATAASNSGTVDQSGWDLTMHSYSHHHQPQQPQAQQQQQNQNSGKEWELSWSDHHQAAHHQQQQQQQLYYHLQQQQQLELKPLILSSSSPLPTTIPTRSFNSGAASFNPSSGYGGGGSYSGASHHLQSVLQQQRSSPTLALLQTQQQQQQQQMFNPMALEIHQPEDHQPDHFLSQRRLFFAADEPRQQHSFLGSYHAVHPALKREEYHEHYHHQVAAANEWLLQGRIGLNLGGRTYFSAEDSLMARLGKRPRLSGPSVHVPLCQAEGCTADLSKAKHYHRRHKVCELHSKAPNVVANGQTQRFCQQCSRFHLLSEFDDSKRSCRKRLADHNRRRRKPHPVASAPDASSAAAKAEQSSDGGEQPEASDQATHSSADTKPTPLLLKTTATSPAASREDSDASKVSSLQQAGGTDDHQKQGSGVNLGGDTGVSKSKSNNGTVAGQRHHSSVSSSADIPLQRSLSRGELPVYKSSTSSSTTVAPAVVAGAAATNPGPNLSLSSSFGSSSHLVNNNNTSSRDNNNKLQTSQCSSVEQCSWLKSTPTNNSSSSSGVAPIRSHNFHDLISATQQNSASTTSAQQPLSMSSSSSGNVFSGHGHSNKPLLTGYGQRSYLSTAEYFRSGSSGEEHQVLKLLDQARPSDLGFMQELPRGDPEQGDDDEGDESLHAHVESCHNLNGGLEGVVNHHHQRPCGEFKLQEMQSLSRVFYN